MGVEIPHMVTDFDCPFDDCNLCPGMDRSRTFEKIEQPPPRNWPSNIRLGTLPVHWRLVGSPQGKEQEKVI